MAQRSPFRYFKTSPEIIRLAVMMHIRLPLLLRNVEDVLHEPGIDICHETVRFGVEASISLARRGTELKLVLKGPAGDDALPDPNLVRTVLDARRRLALYTDVDELQSLVARSRTVEK